MTLVDSDRGWELHEFETEAEAEACYEASTAEDKRIRRPRYEGGTWEVELGIDPDDRYDDDPDREFNRQVLDMVMEEHPDMAFTADDLQEMGL
jgi:hypothetical protein